MHTTLDEFDIIVVGGGPGGCGAAYRAATNGARTLLIEREGCLGGGATTMLVNPFMPHLTGPGPNGESPVVVNAGLYAEVLRRLVERGAGTVINPGTRWTALLFEDEALKCILDDLMAEAGVQVLYHAALFDAEVQDGRLTAVQMAHNAGPLRVSGQVFIDGTGDGLLAHVAGCSWQAGDERGEVMPMTLNFIVAGVDTAKLPSIPELRARAMAGEADTPPLRNTNISCFHALPHGRVHFNAVRVPGDGIDPTALSSAEREGRRRAHNFVDWLRAHIDGFAQCRLEKTGSHIGVRETRRVIGDYLLNFDDLQAARKFADGVALCCYEVDIHGQQPNEGIEIAVPRGDWYEIPYRCLTPRGLANLLMASRSVSADAMVHASLRIMPVVMNIGEAAGIAAAMALPSGAVRRIDVQDLRRRIVACGGTLGARGAMERNSS
jgi:hypothetical protein